MNNWNLIEFMKSALHVENLSIEFGETLILTLRIKEDNFQKVTSDSIRQELTSTRKKPKSARRLKRNTLRKIQFLKSKVENFYSFSNENGKVENADLSIQGNLSASSSNKTKAPGSTNIILPSKNDETAIMNNSSSEEVLKNMKMQLGNESDEQSQSL